MINEETVLSRAAGVLETQIGGGETVLLGPDGDSYFGLEGTSAAIWEQLDSPITVRELLEVLAKRYDVESDTLEPDVRPFLIELKANLLIEFREPS